MPHQTPPVFAKKKSNACANDGTAIIALVQSIEWFLSRLRNRRDSLVSLSGLAGGAAGGARRPEQRAGEIASEQLA
jgi:hypothetical protein